MEKMMYNKLAVAIVVATGIMLATSGSAASVLAQRYTAPTTAPMSGNPSGNLPMKSGNTTSAGSMMNKTAAGIATKVGNTTAANMTKAAGNATSTTITKLGQAIGGGLKGLGNMMSGGKK